MGYYLDARGIHGYPGRGVEIRVCDLDAHLASAVEQRRTMAGILISIDHLDGRMERTLSDDERAAVGRARRRVAESGWMGPGYALASGRLHGVRIEPVVDLGGLRDHLADLESDTQTLEALTASPAWADVQRHRDALEATMAQLAAVVA